MSLRNKLLLTYGIVVKQLKYLMSSRQVFLVVFENRFGRIKVTFLLSGAI